MIQKEVANRLIAIPGDKETGAITYSVYYYAQAKGIMEVPKESFIPEPEVTSKVIKLNIRKDMPVKVNKELDPLSEIDYHINKYKELKEDFAFRKEAYRQFIRLTQGEAALNKIDEYIETKLSKRSIEIPEKNNKAILEKAILNNV